jgi:hypothetical protein
VPAQCGKKCAKVIEAHSQVGQECCGIGLGEFATDINGLRAESAPPRPAQCEKAIA